jgi:hypothetical protein
MAELILEPYAVIQHWRLADAASEQWQTVLSDYLETLARTCDENGACIIGHIKALAVFPDNGYLQISVVSPKFPASIKGAVPSGCRELNLSLNVIVYGLEYELVERLTGETASHVAEMWKAEVNIEQTDIRPSSGQHIHPIHSSKENQHE